MLSHSDFDMKDIGRQRTAVFMIVQDEKKTLHPLATIFIKQCYETLIDVAQESGGKLPYRTNYILDEFANMPPLKDVTTMVTAARSRLIRFTFIIQNYAQLTQVYGKENGETIKGNCNITYLISSELSALEELSKLCGEKIIKVGKDKKEETRPLVTVSDLQRLQQYETITLRLRTMPFKTKLVPNWKMDWGRNYEKATYPTREKREVKLFDIREFVKEQKKKKMNEMMGQNGGDGSQMTNPLFGANPTMGMNPFGMPMPGNTPNGGNGFNVDDLVKRIDAKIAELEEEERKEKTLEAQKTQEQPIETKMPNVNSNPSMTTSQPTPEVPLQPNNTVVNNETVNLEQLSSQNNTKPFAPEPDDDKFFDDFFADE